MAKSPPEPTPDSSGEDSSDPSPAEEAAPRPSARRSGARQRPAPTAPAEDSVDEPADEPAESESPAAKAPAKAAKKAGKASPAKATKAQPARTSARKSATKASGTSTSTSAAGARFGDGGRAGTAPPKKSAGKSRPTKASATAPVKDSGKNAGKNPGPKKRTRPPVVKASAPKPWGLIAATVAVVAVAVLAIGYAVVQVQNNETVTDPSEVEGIQTAEYAAGQDHVTTPVTYTESPPLGGPHDGIWADCSGVVYEQQIRSENAVHSLEHGGIWITYDPTALSEDDIATLSGYVDGVDYTMMSPYADLSSPISLQAWNNQIFVDSVDDGRIADFISSLKQNEENYPEIGASCSNPAFLADPVLQGEESRAPGGQPPLTDAPSTPTT